MRYCVEMSYDGSLFHGFQKQHHYRTIQGELEKLLTKLNDNKPVRVHGSGRTDAGVHALKQVAHFDLDVNITLYSLKKVLNSMLPKDIYIYTVKEVSDKFHARYDIKSKEYIYKLNMGEYSPMDRNYIYQYNKPLDIEAMREGILYLIGSHDFKAFAATRDRKENTIRIIEKASIELQGNTVIFFFKGDGFLKYQVRNMVGTLIDIGNGKRKPKEILDILESRNRIRASKTANPEGLYLSNCIYEEECE